MKLALVAPFWVPRYGGGEVYLDRMVRSLEEDFGWDVHVWTVTQADEDARKGVSNLPEEKVHRQPFEFDPGAFYDDDSWVDWVSEWLDTTPHDVILFAAPSTYAFANLPNAIEFYRNLKKSGTPFGMLQHDLQKGINDLLGMWRRKGLTWEHAKETVLCELENIRNDGYWKIDPQGRDYATPVFFDPDFLIAVSEWGQTFLNPFDEVESLVLHPPLEFPDDLEEATGERPYCVGMINPIPNKGPGIFLNVATALKDRKHTILKGGHGRHEHEPFLKMVDSLSIDVDFIDFVEDINDFYQSCDIVLFPSKFEGYGMTPIEAMIAGTVVVSSDHPAVHEAIGAAAPRLPAWGDPDEWIQTIVEILENPDPWKELIAERVAFVKERQTEELQNLNALLRRCVK